MAGAIMNRVWNLFGMDAEREEDEEFDDIDYGYEDEYDEENEGKGIFGNLAKKSKVVAMPQTQ